MRMGCSQISSAYWREHSRMSTCTQIYTSTRHALWPQYQTNCSGAPQSVTCMFAADRTTEPRELLVPSLPSPEPYTHAWGLRTSAYMVLPSPGMGRRLHQPSLSKQRAEIARTCGCCLTAACSRGRPPAELCPKHAQVPLAPGSCDCLSPGRPPMPVGQATSHQARPRRPAPAEAVLVARMPSQTTRAGPEI